MTYSEKTYDAASRNANLDLLRASAICAVVAYHLIQMSPVPLLFLMRYAWYGQFGVDLFFVLSGWLIGGLYWNEIHRFGKVDTHLFWARRVFRTVPPYLVALGLSWLAVYMQRHEPFDFGFLIFIQNYYTVIPFFLVSWSLCIEEHFYVVVPLLLFALPRTKLVVFCLFALLFLMAPVGRYWESLDGIGGEFGYVRTASHLRTEGLILGFGLSYFPIFYPKQFNAISRLAPAVIAAAGLAFLACQFASATLKYRLEPTVLSLALAATLVWFVTAKPTALASSRLVKAVAIASYSGYLTHALVLHATLFIMRQVSAAYWVVYFPLGLALIVITTAMFYWLVEAPAIRWRDLRIPRRTNADVGLYQKV